MGLTQTININNDIRSRLLAEPESFVGIEIDPDSIKLIFDGNEKLPVQVKPQMIDILKDYRLKSWKVSEDFLSLNYEETHLHSKPDLDVLRNTSRIH
jgi:hypothetical protein